MGWLFRHQSRRELIREQVATSETESIRTETLTYTLRGNILWSVIRMTARQENALNIPTGESITFIGCMLLQGHHGEWGYKEMDESMHPYYYSCPKKYLSMAPVRCQAWRDKVIAHHAQRRLRRSA